MLDSLNGGLAVRALWALGLLGDNLSHELASGSSNGLDPVGLRAVWLTAAACIACVSHGDSINMKLRRQKGKGKRSVRNDLMAGPSTGYEPSIKHAELSKCALRFSFYFQLRQLITLHNHI